MGMPFYVSPEQMMKDRAEYARKGIARGRALVALEYDDGIVFIGENPSRSLHKTSEIYDRIAFAAVGRYNEFEALRVSGIRLADIRGYQYARSDVTAKSVANSYSQALGIIFMAENKPFEVEVLIAQVDEQVGELFHILYDGSIVDEHGYVAIGGHADELTTALEQRYEDAMNLAESVTLGGEVLAEVTDRDIPPNDLEISGLARSRQRRKFFRLDNDDVNDLIDTQ